MKAVEGIQVFVSEKSITAFCFDEAGFKKNIPNTNLSKVDDVIVHGSLNKGVYDKIKNLQIGTLYITSSEIELSDISALNIKAIANHSAMGYIFDDALKVPADIRLPENICLHNPVVYLAEGNKETQVVFEKFQTDAQTASMLISPHAVSIIITSGKVTKETFSGLSNLQGIEFKEGVSFQGNILEVPPSCETVTFRGESPNLLALPGTVKNLSFANKVPSAIISNSGVFSRISVPELSPEVVAKLQGFKTKELLTLEITAEDIKGIDVKYIGSQEPCVNNAPPMKVSPNFRLPTGVVLSSFIVKEH